LEKTTTFIRWLFIKYSLTKILLILGIFWNHRVWNGPQSFWDFVFILEILRTINTLQSTFLIETWKNLFQTLICGILFTTHWWWCWWVWTVCGSGASNVVRLIPLSHCFLRSTSIIPSVNFLWLIYFSVRLVLPKFTKSSILIVWKI
jgi:hypothetical protein